MLKAGSTLTGATINGTVLSPLSMGRALGYPEKDFLQDIMNNITSSNLSRIMDVLPAPAASTVYKMIGENDRADAFVQQTANSGILNRNIPGVDSNIYSEQFPLETPAIETFEQEGLDSHDAGFGWYDQMASMERSKRAGRWSGETLYPNNFESSVTVLNFSHSVAEQGKIRNAIKGLARRIEITEDNADMVELEVIV
jgi:hypothetical protein